MAIQIAIIEDSQHIAANLEKIIKSNEEFEHVLTCTSGEIALKKIPIIRPQICLLDLGLPGIGGLDVLPLLKTSLPDLKVVLFTVFEDGETIIQAIQRGADGYLLKDTLPELLIAELKVVMMGGATLTPRVALKASQLFFQEKSYKKRIVMKKKSNEVNALSPRQTEILNYIILGFTYSEIAAKLAISPHTVRRHIENIYQNLQVQSKAEAVTWGIQSGFGKNLLK